MYTKLALGFIVLCIWRHLSRTSGGFLSWSQGAKAEEILTEKNKNQTNFVFFLLRLPLLLAILTLLLSFSKMKRIKKRWIDVSSACCFANFYFFCIPTLYALPICRTSWLISPSFLTWICPLFNLTTFAFWMITVITLHLKLAHSINHKYYVISLVHLYSSSRQGNIYFILISLYITFEWHRPLLQL